MYIRTCPSTAAGCAEFPGRWLFCSITRLSPLKNRAQSFHPSGLTPKVQLSQPSVWAFRVRSNFGSGVAQGSFRFRLAPRGRRNALGGVGQRPRGPLDRAICGPPLLASAMAASSPQTVRERPRPGRKYAGDGGLALVRVGPISPEGTTKGTLIYVVHFILQKILSKTKTL